MSGYTKVLVAIDLSDESGAIIKKAQGVCVPDAEVHLAYVQEPMEAVYMGVVPYGPVFVGMDQVEDRLQKELQAKLASWGEAHGITAERTHFLSGSPARELHRFVKENGVDLVVLGTHGQKGVQLLLGSTANAVLHGSACDVLAVRVNAGH